MLYYRALDLDFLVTNIDYSKKSYTEFLRNIFKIEVIS